MGLGICVDDDVVVVADTDVGCVDVVVTDTDVGCVDVVGGGDTEMVGLVDDGGVEVEIAPPLQPLLPQVWPDGHALHNCPTEHWTPELSQQTVPST